MQKRRKVGFSAQKLTSSSWWRRKGEEDAVKTGLKAGKKYMLAHNFGADGRTMFSSQEDYDRFEAYLYILNAVDGPRASNFFLDGSRQNVFEAARGEQLIAIAAYSFTPKEFHILMTPRVDDGIPRFMQKLQTAYTMYFNTKYARTGRLFHSSYRSTVAATDDHLKYLYSLVHLIPAKLFDDSWESAESDVLVALALKAIRYRYSSIGEYVSGKFVITQPDQFPEFLKRIKNAQSLSRSWLSGKKSDRIDVLLMRTRKRL